MFLNVYSDNEIYFLKMCTKKKKIKEKKQHIINFFVLVKFEQLLMFSVCKQIALLDSKFPIYFEVEKGNCKLLSKKRILLVMIKRLYST